MKILFALWLAILLATHDVIAHAADTPEAMASPYYDRTILVVPKGAAITEIISTRAQPWGMPTVYVKFVFEKQCYLLIDGPNQIALTVKPCK